MFGNTNNNLNPNNDTMVQNCPGDSISSMKWSPKDDVLLVTAWDGSVTCYKDKPIKQTRANAPVLCGCWKPDGSQVLYGCCDNGAYLWDVQSGQTKQVAQHQASVKACAFIDNNVFVTGSWDRTLKYWDLSKQSNNPVMSVDLPERVYCMDYKDGMLVVGCADKKIRVYDVRNPSNCAKEIKTTLKHQFRCISLFHDSTGFAVGSIEGRVMIHTYNNTSKTFAYKCHRDDNNIYAVHSIAFHQIGTFLTAGADGTIIFWDKDQKQKLRTLNACPLPMVAADFNRNHTLLAYACSYDWGRGIGGHQNQGSQIYIRQVQPEDVQRKPKSNSRR